MSVEVREASPKEIEEWDQLVRRFANHRIGHTMAWIRSLEATGHGRAHFLLFRKDGEIVGCLPGLRSAIGPIRLFGSPPPASQTVSMGPAFDERRVSSSEMLGALVPFLERRLGIHHMEMMTHDLEAGAMTDLGFRGEHWPTYRVALYPGDEARTLKGLKENARRNIRRGQKLGLEVRFENDESFVDEHYEQIKEVYVKGGNAVNFSKQRVLECFRRMRDAGSLLAVSVYLPEGPVNIATGMFTIEDRELVLWTWAHRIQHRWHRPTELMTWTVMQRAVQAGCDTFDLMGLGEFKTKFGAELDERKYRWVRSRYQWLGRMRDLAAKGLHWQQSVRGRLARLSASRSEAAEPPDGDGTREKVAASVG